MKPTKGKYSKRNTKTVFAIAGEIQQQHEQQVLSKIRNITNYISFPPQIAYKLIDAGIGDLRTSKLSRARWLIFLFNKRTCEFKIYAKRCALVVVNKDCRQFLWVCPVIDNETRHNIFN